jgi:antitoxin (DNA-binding transcriptional repressor) of toxin-antitoxin stability system
MKAVGVRDLKANLSRYLREVRAGEILLVTDRGQVVAELRAPGLEVSRPETDLDRRLRMLALRLPLTIGEPQDASVYRTSPIRVPEGTARALLDEEREEN